MPENNGHVSQDQCETRRYHCGEAMANSFHKLESQFGGFLSRLEDQVAPLVKQQTETAERAKSNTHRINWLYGIVAVVVGGVVLAAVVAALVGGVAEMLTDAQMTKLQLLKQVVDFTLAAQAVMSTPEPEEPEPIDLAAFRTSIRNQVLAGSGVKAAWLGTLSTEPEYDADDIAALGVTAAAAQLLADCRDELRAAALAIKVD